MSPAAAMLRGIAAMVASQLAFLLNDTLIKLAGDALPMGEIIFVRGVISTLLVGTAAVALGLHRQIGLAAHRSVSWRVVGELGAAYFYILALLHMPIANVTIIFQAAPLVATAGAALFLAERVGWRRWAAIGIGFFGVLMVVRPGLAGFDAYALLVLAAVLCVAFRDVWTRAMPSAIPTLLVTGVTAGAVAILGAVLGLTEDWVMPSPLILAYLAGAAVLVTTGYFLVIVAMRLGDMSVTAPFRYVAVVFAIALGFLVWGDVPDTMTLAGSAVIVGTGVYALYRERKVKGRVRAERDAAPAAVPPPI
jgi:drug/metabolite transporter (DMT)-like permease